nr:hypothetical protein [Propionibacterium cyclohexanicum]
MIVVIAILAAISIVAYNGIQDRARQTAATSAARQLSDKAEIYFVENDSYPANLSAIGIEDSASTSYQYRFSSSSPDIYCATATSGNKSAWVSNAQKTPQDGACAGHANGGVQPEIVTNLVRNPKGLSGAVGNGFFTVTNAGNALTLNVPFGERDNWTRVRIAGATGLYRMSVQPSDLEGGESYTASVLVANPGTTTLNVFMDFCDTPGISTTLAAGEIKRISTTGARANYDSTYSFMDISTTNAGSEFLEAYS